MRSCTVVVVQYNPVKEKLFRTILSIVKQKNITVQIIIADDGSSEDYYEETERMLQNHGFTDCCLSKNSTNQGTVMNYRNAVSFAKYKYIFGISPGDYYYDETVLSEVVDTMEREGLQYLFGKVYPYRLEQNKLKIVDLSLPSYTLPYIRYRKTKDIRFLQKMIVVYRDNNPSPSFCWKKSTLNSFLNRIAGKIVYTEDLIRVFAFLDEIKTGYLNRYIAWYEYGTGISTSGNARWKEKIRKDENTFFQMLMEQYPDSDLVKRANLFQKLENIGGIRSRILKILLFPDRFFYLLIHHVLYKEKNTPPDKDFIRSLYTEGDGALTVR